MIRIIRIIIIVIVVNSNTVHTNKPKLELNCHEKALSIV